MATLGKVAGGAAKLTAAGMAAAGTAIAGVVAASTNRKADGAFLKRPPVVIPYSSSYTDEEANRLIPADAAADDENYLMITFGKPYDFEGET